MMQRLTTYFREARAELTRVTWPSRSEIIESSEAVLLLAAISMVVLWLYDAMSYPVIQCLADPGACGQNIVRAVQGLFG
jgi:preprotein translocase subunit SecE